MRRRLSSPLVTLILALPVACTTPVEDEDVTSGGDAISVRVESSYAAAIRPLAVQHKTTPEEHYLRKCVGTVVGERMILTSRRCAQATQRLNVFETKAGDEVRGNVRGYTTYQRSDTHPLEPELANFQLTSSLMKLPPIAIGARAPGEGETLDLLRPSGDSAVVAIKVNVRAGKVVTDERIFDELVGSPVVRYDEKGIPSIAAVLAETDGTFEAVAGLRPKPPYVLREDNPCFPGFPSAFCRDDGTIVTCSSAESPLVATRIVSDERACPPNHTCRASLVSAACVAR